MTDLSFGSLFAGVGGFDLGFEAAGWQCSFQVEWDKHCQQVLSRHWPDVPRWSDVSTVNGAELPPVDCITFGSPCQDLSVAGRRAGLDGDRSNLFHQATRIIKEMRNATGNQYPRVAIWENVPGALSSNKGADFATVIDNMADSGALVLEWAVLDAQHFGVPQRRRRIFLVAIYDPAIARNCTGQILPVTEGSRGDHKKSNPPREITTALTANGVGTCGADDNQAQAGHLIPLETPFVKVIRSGARDADGNLPPEVWREEQTAPTLNSMDNTGETRATVIFTAQRVGEAPRIYHDTTPSLLSRMGTGGNNVPLIADTIGFSHTQGLDPQASTEAWPTLRVGGGGHAVLHPVLAPTLTSANNPSRSPQSTEITNQVAAVFEAQYAVRRLTPIECERLMGWPDDHTRWKADGTEQADSHRYKQCGNGVAAPVAQWVAQQLRRIIHAHQ